MKRLILIDESQILYTIPEAVKKTGKSRATLYNWKRNDWIEFVKINGRVFLTQAEIERINNENTGL